MTLRLATSNHSNLGIYNNKGQHVRKPNVLTWFTNRGRDICYYMHARGVAAKIYSGKAFLVITKLVSHKYFI